MHNLSANQMPLRENNTHMPLPEWENWSHPSTGLTVRGKEALLRKRLIGMKKVEYIPYGSKFVRVSNEVERNREKLRKQNEKHLSVIRAVPECKNCKRIELNEFLTTDKDFDPSKRNKPCSRTLKKQKHITISEHSSCDNSLHTEEFIIPEIDVNISKEEINIGENDTIPKCVSKQNVTIKNSSSEENLAVNLHSTYRISHARGLIISCAIIFGIVCYTNVSYESYQQTVLLLSCIYKQVVKFILKRVFNYSTIVKF
uniref:Uncharacterized protein n=1 Tax=Clastoptera arizonana TaxID=38151 RepID=A0A1B6DGH4_9HEMI